MTTVTDSITNTADDGYSSGKAPMRFTYAYDYFGHGSLTNFYAGVRFRSVAVPNAATITSATLKLNILHAGASHPMKVFGNAVDNAPVWATTNRFKNVTKTTASTSFTPVLAQMSLDVTTIIQEIVNRPGWASGNNLAMILDPRSATVAGVNAAFEDLSRGGGKPAQLIVNYAGGASSGLPHTGFLSNTGGMMNRGVH